MNNQDPTSDNRSIFDWIMFLLIHLILIGGIAYAGFQIYGPRLGVWVAASAFIAGVTSSYLFAKIVPGETVMKVLLGLAVAANAAYLVHNGAQAIGVEAFNAAQIKKYELGMAAAAGATTRTIARALGASAKEASNLERAFSDGVSTIAALLAFLELSLAIVIFSIASKRTNEARRLARPTPIATPRAVGFSTGGGGSLNYPPPTIATSGSDPKAQPPTDR